MQKVLIHYFSGTGNSLLAAKQLSQELENYEFAIKLHAIENGLHNTDNTYTLHIFFFPIYATAAPHIVRKYIRNLPDGKNVRAAVISTNGKISTLFRDGYQGWALHQVRLYLSLKNYHVFFSDTLDYPHNITVAIPPRKEKYNKKIISQASAKFPIIAEKIANGQKFNRNFFLPNIIWSLPFGILYSLFGRRGIGKIFAANSSCNSCKLCVEKCPVKAIQSFDSKIRWKWNCEGCMRCINTCPRQAIQASAVRILAIFAAAFVYPFFLIQRFIPIGFIQKSGSIEAAIFKILIYAISFIVFFLLLDWFIYRISYLPILKNIVSWGYTRLFGRYHAKRFEGQFLNKK
jgi:flavodoxin/Pyruvate/2-oxoacid:ferredoxin oxidoreductase delta subunit